MSAGAPPPVSNVEDIDDDIIARVQASISEQPPAKAPVKAKVETEPEPEPQPRDQSGKFRVKDEDTEIEITLDEPRGPIDGQAANEAEGAEAEPGEETEPVEPGAAKPEGTEAGEEEEGLSSVAEVAQLLDVEEADFLDAITVKVADDREVSINDLISAYQAGPADEATRVREVRAAREEADTAANKRVEEEMTKLANITAQLIEEIQTMEGSTNWRDLDPGEAAQLRLRQYERHERVKRALAAMDEATAKRETEQKEKFEEWGNEEAKLMLKAFPTWADAEVRGKAEVQMEKFLKDIVGFEDSEIQQVIDHRSWRVIWMASEFDRLVRQQPARKKKLLKLGKRLKPGARTRAGGGPRKAVRSREVEALRQRLRETGSERDAGRLIARAGLV